MNLNNSFSQGFCNSFRPGVLQNAYLIDIFSTRIWWTTTSTISHKVTVLFHSNRKLDILLGRNRKKAFRGGILTKLKFQKSTFSVYDFFQIFFFFFIIPSRYSGNLLEQNLYISFKTVLHHFNPSKQAGNNFHLRRNFS